MGAGESENQIVIEIGAGPRVHVVTLGAVGREGSGHVIRIRGGLQVGAVARQAVGAHPDEYAGCGAGMTAFAFHFRVRPQKREPIGMLARGLVYYRRPTLHGMALLAMVTHLSAVQVGVACGTIVGDFLEDGVDMTLLARHAGMHSA
jgi:hypothetical protein